MTLGFLQMAKHKRTRPQNMLPARTRGTHRASVRSGRSGSYTQHISLSHYFHSYTGNRLSVMKNKMGSTCHQPSAFTSALIFECTLHSNNGSRNGERRHFYNYPGAISHFKWDLGWHGSQLNSDMESKLPVAYLWEIRHI